MENEKFQTSNASLDKVKKIQETVNKPGFESVIRENPTTAIELINNLCNTILKDNKAIDKKEDGKNEESVINENPATDILESANESESEALAPSEPVLIEAKIADKSSIEVIETLKDMNIVHISHGEYISPSFSMDTDLISPKNLKCPVCNNKVSDVYLSKSRLVADGMSKGLHKKYKEIDPIYFELYACSNCGYTNYTQDFEKISKRDIELAENFLSGIGFNNINYVDNIFNINYVFLKYYLTVLLLTDIPEKKIAVAKTWLRISWLYESVGDTQLELFAKDKAYQLYSDAYYNTAGFTKDVERELLMTMATLLIELDREKEASRFLMSVLQLGDANSLIYRKAEDMLYDIRQKNK